MALEEVGGWGQTPFWNIAAGIGHLMEKLSLRVGGEYSQPPNFGGNTPNWGTWKLAVGDYYGSGSDVPRHVNIVWHFLAGYLEQTKKRRIERGEIKP